MPDLPRRIIVAASSDIGHALARDWLASACEVWGTFRTPSDAVDSLSRSGAGLVRCDLSDADLIAGACAELRRRAADWDVLVLAPGVQDPIGPFLECDFTAWAASIEVNFTGPMRVLHELLPVRRRGAELPPLVLLFAGGGTNNATLNYSAYTLSKIALIKAVELLGAELPDCRFAIVGPGWVKTKIHESTLNANERAGANYRRTLEKLAKNECVPMRRVVECCNWLVGAPADVASGRNFSLVFDAWGDPRLDELLRNDREMYKLRRAGNSKLVAERTRAHS
ncbi:MAG TPA: SDR family oxidoreductase [Pirellulales bacterium]|jgi:NAD(P)-dependent dehydrogenase (short-subunit alcohol dehydrogenase family)|nr:SDR family oxidoreductase [Pirellulales bacterium]